MMPALPLHMSPAEPRPLLNELLVSADSHILEPRDLWEVRIDRAFRERAPRLVSEAHGDQWYADGHYPMGRLGLGGAAGIRFEDPHCLTVHARHADLRAGAMDPVARLMDIDRDGVFAEVLFPTATLHAYRIPDPVLVSAIFRAYNQWIAELCAAAPRRLKGVALLNVDNVAEAVSELERAARRGLVAAALPVQPAQGSYDQAEFAPLWEAAQDLELPLVLHVGSERWHPGVRPLQEQTYGLAPLLQRELEIRACLASLILYGVFERYPRLRIGAAEYEASWIPYFLYRLDDCYTQRFQGLHGRRFRGAALPSDFFRSNVFVSFQQDPHCVRDLSVIGEDNLLWGSDYPHAESTFPRSREILGGLLAGSDADSRRRITHLNAARLFHIELPGAAPGAGASER